MGSVAPSGGIFSPASFIRRLLSHGGGCDLFHDMMATVEQGLEWRQMVRVKLLPNGDGGGQDEILSSFDEEDGPNGYAMIGMDPAFPPSRASNTQRLLGGISPWRFASNHHHISGLDDEERSPLPPRSHTEQLNKVSLAGLIEASGERGGRPTDQPVP